MRLLALDTSTEFLSLALQDGEQLYLHHAHAGQSHSQTILPTIRGLLNEAGLDIHDLNGVVFGAGPGSFTGLRIGCGVAQGLAFGASLPVIGIGTLLAMAEASGHSRVVACLDARMGEVYHAAYIKHETGWQEVLPPTVCKPELVTMVEGADWHGVGNAWGVYGDVLQALHGERLVGVMPDLYPEASAMLNLAAPVLAAGLGQPAEEAAPVYVRNRVALKTQEREAGLKLN